MKVLLSWLQEFAPFPGDDPVALGDVMSDLGWAVVRRQQYLRWRGVGSRKDRDLLAIAEFARERHERGLELQGPERRDQVGQIAVVFVRGQSL